MNHCKNISAEYFGGFFPLKICLFTAQWSYTIHCIMTNSCDKEIKFCVLTMLFFSYINNFQNFRSNMTLTSHPDKEELIMFGGEFLTGSKVYSRTMPWFKLYICWTPILILFFLCHLVKSQNWMFTEARLQWFKLYICWTPFFFFNHFIESRNWMFTELRYHILLIGPLSRNIFETGNPT